MHELGLDVGVGVRMEGRVSQIRKCVCKAGGMRSGALVRVCELWDLEEGRLQSWSVSTGLGQRVPSYCGSACFFLRLMLESADRGKQMALANMGVPHPMR